MGRSSSKPIPPNNALLEIQIREERRKTHGNKKEKQREKERKQREKRKKKQDKRRDKNNKKRKPVKVQAPQLELRNDTFDQIVNAKLRKQLEKTFCTFINNQLALTVQFFGNFDSERKFAQNRILEKENGFNQKLEEHSIILPNALDKGVESRVQYMPKYGPGKFDIVPLHTQTMYVIFENIDIAKPNDANYDSISPICKVDMETDFSQTLQIKGYDSDALKTHKWKGYVRLKLRVNPIEIIENDYRGIPLNFGRRSGVETQNSSIYISAFNQGLADETRRQDEARSSNSSAYISESEYDYAYITQLNTHHPLAELTMSNLRERIMVDIKVLPESCISHLHSFIGIRMAPEDDDDAEYSDEEGYGSSALERYNNNIQYLNSKSFMCYFADLLQQKLAKDLDLDESEFDEATYRGSSIHTKRFEIIPAVHVAYNAQVWPDCAFQFKRRERAISINPLTGQTFQWPTQSMINRIESFGYHVIPIGYAPKVRKNPYRELEWKIVFPKAERYLEGNLTSTQVKVLMISKALVKTFVEPQQFDNTVMFTIDHLRTHLFWECERDYCAWPEEFLGEVLVKFLKSFLMQLRKTFLSDFFIQERNLFESIPESSLSRLSNIISDIIANPTMHILMAYRNLHQWEDFFPKLNYKKIYYSLVENNYLKLKALSNNSKSSVINDNGDELYSKTTTEDVVSVQGLIGYAQEREKTKAMSRRTLQLKQKELLRKLELEKRKQSVDSINLEFIFNQTMRLTEKKKDFNCGVENLRRTNIIETFIEQFIVMAENSLPIRSIHQAKIYLNQAKRLCTIYSDYGCDINAIEFISRVEIIEKEIEILRLTGNDIPPPALPLRTSLEPIKSFKQKERPKKLNNFSESGEIERRPSIVRFSNENGSVSSGIVVEAQVHASKSPKYKNKSPNSILKSSNKSSEVSVNEIEPWNFDENIESTSGKFEINSNSSEIVKKPESKVLLKSTLRSVKDKFCNPTTVLKFDFTKTESIPETIKSPPKKELVKSKLQTKHNPLNSPKKILKHTHLVKIEPSPEVVIVSKTQNGGFSNNKPKKVTIMEINAIEDKNDYQKEPESPQIVEELDTFEKRKTAVHRMLRDTLPLRLPGIDTTKL